MKLERTKSSKTKEDGPADATLVTSTTPSSSSSASSPQNPSGSSSSSSFPLDTPVWISRKEGPVEGRVAYKGPVSFAQGTDWIGVRLTGSSEGLGKNDGSVQGSSYFSCPPKCGLFVRQASLSVTPPTSTTHQQQHQQKSHHKQRTNTTTRGGARRKTPPSTRLQRRRQNNQSLPDEPPAPFVGLTIEVISPIPEAQPKDKDNTDKTTAHKSDQQHNTDQSTEEDGWTWTAPIMAPSSLERDIRYYSLTTCSSHASNLPLEDQTLASINVRNTHSSKQAQSTIRNGPSYLEYYEDDDDQSTIPSDDDDEDPQYWQSPTCTFHTREPLSSVQVVSPNIAQNNNCLPNNGKPKRSTSPLPPPVMSPDKLERIAQRDRLQALKAWKKQKGKASRNSQKSTMMRV